MPTRPNHSTTINPPLSNNSNLIFYPAYTYRHSPTWFTWAKLTCYEIHHILSSHPATTLNHQPTLSSGPNSNLVLFYHNHPIQYIQVTGLIVAVDSSKENLLILTLDDSSGSVLDLVIRKPRASQAQAGAQRPSGDLAANETTLTDDQTRLRDLYTTLTTTTTIQPGHLLRAKGHLTTFRSTRQLSLLRGTFPLTPTQELSLIAARTAFNETILSKPWVVTAKQQAKMLRMEQGERAEVGKKAKGREGKKRRREEREGRWRGEIERRWAVDENARAAEAEACARDGEVVMRRREEIRRGEGGRGGGL